MSPLQQKCAALLCALLILGGFVILLFSTHKARGYPLSKVHYDGHSWVVHNRGPVAHHPSCPCQVTKEKQ